MNRSWWKSAALSIIWRLFSPLLLCCRPLCSSLSLCACASAPFSANACVSKSAAVVLSCGDARSTRCAVVLPSGRGENATRAKSAPGWEPCGGRFRPSCALFLSSSAMNLATSSCSCRQLVWNQRACGVWRRASDRAQGTRAGFTCASEIGWAELCTGIVDDRLRPGERGV